MKFRLNAGLHFEAKIPHDVLDQMSEEELLAKCAEEKVKLPRFRPDMDSEDKRQFLVDALKTRELVYHWQLNPVIDTDTDLIAKFGPEKFSRVHETQYATAQPTQRIPGESDEQFRQRMLTLLSEIQTVIQGGAGVMGSNTPPPSQDPVKAAQPQPSNAQRKSKDSNKPDHTATLNAMTEVELRKWAEEEEIPLPSGLKGRDQVLGVVKQALGTQSGHH